MNNKIIVVMPAYNASKTLEMTYRDINRDVVDEILLVDDGSRDDTIDKAKKLGIIVIAHPKNMGYGANLKTCFKEALKMGAEIVIVLHPDYQYCPKRLDEMVRIIKNNEADVVLGSRIEGGTAIKGGMPLYKFLGNNLLNFIQNMAYGLNLSDYATGYKAFKREVLENIPFVLNSNGFLFDEEITTQAVNLGYRITQIPIPTKYFKEASTVNFLTSLNYGLGTVLVVIEWLLHRTGIIKFAIFKKPDDINKE